MTTPRDPLRHVPRSPRRIRGELDEELSFHLEMRTRELERAGYSPAERPRRLGAVSATGARRTPYVWRRTNERSTA